MNSGEYVGEVCQHLGLIRSESGLFYGEVGSAVVTLEVVQDAPLGLRFMVKHDGRFGSSIQLTDELESLVAGTRHEVYTTGTAAPQSRSTA